MSTTKRFRLNHTAITINETAIEYDLAKVENAHQYWHDVIATQPDHEPEKENLIVVLCNTRLFPYAWHRVSLGTLSETSAHPRELLRPVIVGNAHSFIMMHNHPGGDPSPSRNDINFTSRIRDLSEILQIRLNDHLVIGTPTQDRNAYFSFREAGLI